MTYDPHKPDASWHMVQPGCYTDPAGCGHIFPDEILAFLQMIHPQAGFDPNDKDDYDLVLKIFTETMLAQNPGMQIKIIKHDRKKH